MLPAFLTTVLFSWSVICAARSTRLVGGATANFWRLLLASVFLAVWAHGWGTGLHGAALPYFMLSGCIGFGVGDLAFFYALPRLGSRLTILMVQCLAAPMAATIEWFWLGTVLTGRQLLCAAIILTGVAVALAPGREAKMKSPHWLGGIVFGVLAALGQGFGAVLSRKAFVIASATGQNIDGPTSAYQRILGGLAVAGLGWWWSWRRKLVRDRLLPMDYRKTGTGVARTTRWQAGQWILLNALAGAVLGVSCYQWALKTTPTGIVLAIVATTPLVVMPMTFLLEGDRPRPTAFAGGIIAVLGAIALVLTG